MKWLFPAASGAVSGAFTAAYVLIDHPTGRLVITVAWPAALVAVAVVIVVQDASPPDRRPSRFRITPRGFVAPHRTNRVSVLAAFLLGLPLFLTLAIAGRMPVTALAILPLALGLARVFGPPPITLTPAGIVLGLPQARRTIAWEQPLAVPQELAVNPWFVSAAIRWYAEHADERAMIGTPEGHARLLDALSA